VAWVSERTKPTERPPLVGELMSNVADRWCHVVSVTVPYGRILGFSRQEPLLFYQVAPQLYSRGWVDPVRDPLLLRKFVSAGNRTRTSGSVARNSDHQTTEAVYFLLHNIYKFRTYLTGSTIHLRCVARTLTTRPQRRSTFFYISYINSIRTSQETQ
jgi:hypothetical protein